MKRDLPYFHGERKSFTGWNIGEKEGHNADQSMKVLIVEDDGDTAGFIVKGLQELGHTVDRAATGSEGLLLAADGPYDVMIIDRMLPGLDGLTIVKTIRSAGVKTPVLFLTTMGGIGDRVEGLDAGGDDYLVKPFAFAELNARINALFRRPQLSDGPTMLRVADLELDLLKRSVTRNGLPIDLQPQEFKLLEYLMRHAGRVVTRTMLLENVWHYHFEPQTSVVETHISRLRGKIERNLGKPLIHTVRGSGYILRAPD